jgi:hypothetical protein
MTIDTTHVHNVGEFYSQHYLDAVLREDLGPVFEGWSAREKGGGPKTPTKRLARLAEPYFEALADFHGAATEDARRRVCTDFHARLLEALGYERAPQLHALPDGVELPLTLALEVHGRPFLWVLELEFPASEDDADPLGAVPLDLASGDADARPPVPPIRELLDGALLRQDEPPRWVLLLAGPDVLLIERNKWPQGQYLRFGLGEMLGQRKPAALRALAGLLHREVLLPEGGRSLLDQIDDKSHKHAFAVSTDLEYGVREAIELIGNEAVHYKRVVTKEKIFDRPELAGKLARECVTYLYRLLFLFYVEARGGDMGIVPMKTDAYRLGLSLESLRDLELVPLATERARNGYFIHHSLDKLFEVVQLGWPVSRQRNIEAQHADAVDLRVAPQRSPLFDRARTPILSAVKLRNFVLQQVIALLSLSRPGAGRGGRRQRGRISYAQLGINQLGAVYESLLSYSGFFTQADTFEVQNPNDEGNEDARIFHVPRSAIGDYAEEEFRTTASGEKVVHPKGTFLFRLAGRDREKSASYYTPEVLTRCLTKYTLEARLGRPGEPGALTADEILELTICEPAMGSGAFLNEAVGQLAHAYLARKQAELGEQIPAEDYPREWLRVKYHFVVNRCHGVDLNPLATELGKVSLWLSVLQGGVEASFLDLRLRVGNSLVGARRAVYAPAELTLEPNEKTGTQNWLTMAPTRVAPGEARPEGHVYHFLLPDAAMAAYDKDKVVKKLWPEELAALRQWRRQVCKPLTQAELERLQQVSADIDTLWRLHLEQRRSVLARVHQPIAPWGQAAPEGPGARWKTIEECEQISRELDRPNSATRRLRAVMNSWCELWTWPLDRAAELPSRARWADEVEAILASERPELGDAVGYMHWELEFAEVFEDRGGFDLILGNPPWIKLEWKESGILGELRPTLVLRKLSAKQIADERAEVLATAGAREEYLGEFCRVMGELGYLNAVGNYPLLAGVQTNLYKCFLVRTLELIAAEGSAGTLHQKGLYDDPKGGRLRGHLMPRIHLHAHFINKLLLFSDIEDQKHYEMTVCLGEPRVSPSLVKASNILHPATLDGSFEHDGLGPVPGIKDETGSWDLRPHASRLVKVDEDALALFARVYDAPGTPPAQARLPVIHSAQMLSILRRFADAPRKLADEDGSYACTVCFDETGRQRDGTIRRNVRFPDGPGEWVVSGPHFYVGTPFNKTPNEGCRHNQDYSVIDLTTISEDYLPRTNYLPACSAAEYRERTPRWKGRPVTEFYRYANRTMIAPTGERTLTPAIIPPGPAHLDLVFSIAFEDESTLLACAGYWASIVIDFFVKSTGKGHARADVVGQLPVLEDSIGVVRDRTLRLNCLTSHYAPLYERNLPTTLLPSAKADPRTAGWDRAPRKWTWDAPLRTPYARRQALVELDALAALSLGLSLDELRLIYRVQFPVLRQYEAETFYDRRGKIVFTVNRGLCGVGVSRKQWREIQDAEAGDALPEWASDAQGAFEPPFDRCKREDDMAQAYGYFQRELGLAGR